MSTYDIAALRNFETRLAEAKWPDRELDVAILCTLLGWKYEKRGKDRNVCSVALIQPYDRLNPSDPLSFWKNKYGVTASLDAAVSLAECVLPGWSRMIQNCGITDTSKCFAIVGPNQDDARHSGEAATEALALCLAIIRALIAQETPAP